MRYNFISTGAEDVKMTVKGHSRSLLIAIFNRSHMISCYCNIATFYMTANDLEQFFSSNTTVAIVAHI